MSEQKGIKESITMITTKEFKEFLEEDERQILVLKNANLLKINAVDE